MNLQMFAPPLDHDPTGKCLLALPAGIASAAVYGGAQREYRYCLERCWEPRRPSVLFVMMNPSTASEFYDDPTVAKCRRYAQAWQYGSLLIGNTFAYRATHPIGLLRAPDPIGPDNDAHLLAMAEKASLVILAYGKPHPTLRSRGLQVARSLSRGGARPVHVLRLCADGTPAHPLYLPGSLQPLVWDVSL